MIKPTITCLIVFALPHRGYPSSLCVSGRAAGEEFFDFVVVSLEWVAHDEEIAAIAGDGVPVDHIRQIALLKCGDGAGAAGCAGVERRRMRRLGAADTVVPFADPFPRRDAEEEAVRGIDVVIFEIETLQPGIIPAQAFGFDESLEQPFLRDPIDAADERLRILLERFENEAPAFQQPIRFRAVSSQMPLRQFVKLPLHIERADAFAVFKIDNPLPGGIAGDIARALDGIGQDKIARQAILFE